MCLQCRNELCQASCAAAQFNRKSIHSSQRKQSQSSSHTDACSLLWKWKWNLTEVTSHDETGSALQKKLPISGSMDPRVLVESFNRTRWLDKLRPSGASQKADGPEGPMAPIVTTGVLITRHPCAGATIIFLYRSTEDPRIVRVSLAQGSCKCSSLDVSTKQGPCCSSSKKTVCTCHPCTKGHAKFLCAKNNNVQPIPCRSEHRHSCAGSPIICGRLFRDIRTFGRAVEGSSVSPLADTMGGLSGGGRGDDTSGVCPAPSLITSRLRARALPLDLGCGTCCPPFVVRKA